MNSVKIQLKTDTIANWTLNENALLLNGEAAVVQFPDGSPKLKIGNGITVFKDLPYIGNELAANTSWSELTAMVDNSELVPGMKYRIIDYVTRVNQEDCSSAEHPFDIIVTAVSENTLDENATAAIHDGDDYFLAHEFGVPDYSQYMTYKRANVEAWQLKYCLFNDDRRF